MEITKKKIDYLCNLARINLSDKEKESLSHDLTRITAMVSKINEIPTENVSPLVTITENNYNFYRKDELQPSLPVEEIEKLAPQFERRCFIVPKVIE